MNIEAVIFDWAGTTVDFGSLAPIRAFQSLFTDNGVTITQAEAREPMGTEKREHITRLLAMPRISEAWLNKHGSLATVSDIDRLYEEFVPLQLDTIRQCAQLIPGFDETLKYMHQQGIKTGGNTGYNHIMLGALTPAATALGYTPDSSVCASDVPVGRPAPAMSLLNAAQLAVSSIAHCIKVDDTTMGVQEGRNAGMWTVGVSISGNETGLSLADWSALDEAAQNTYRQQASARLSAAGAHYVIDSVADLPPVIEAINQRLSQGERP